MGGMTCYGPVRPHELEPMFRSDWERRVFAMVALVIEERYSSDELRFAIERIHPSIYLTASYYEKWLTALERFSVEDKLISADELRARTSGDAPKPGLSPDQACDDAQSLVQFAERGVQESAKVGIKIGDRIVVRNINRLGHTRLPHYVRGKCGTIDRFLGMQTLPDTNAHRLGKFEQNVYAVKFSARELWGERASERDSVYVDLWECYFDRVDEK
jgi:nitrile hydratase